MSLLLDYDPRAAPGAYPVPAGRGRWRVTLHRRNYSPARWDQTIVSELSSAMSRQVTQQLDSPAEMRFSLDGRAADAATIAELQHEVYAWRWDDQTGADVAVFRGVIDHTEDHISAQTHTVNVVAHDYLSTIQRRFVVDTTPQVFTQADQDTIVASLLARAGGGPSSLAPYTPGSIIPVGAAIVTPAGVSRAKTGTLRDRTYNGGKSIGEAITELAHISGGFDFDVLPEAQADDGLALVDAYGTVTTLGSRDALRLFWPSQGIARPDVVLVYGGNVSDVARTVNSGDYANHVRSLGNSGSADPAAAQLVGVAASADASSTTVGWWPYGDSAPSDVNQQATLNQRAAGVLADMGVLVPSYTLTMRPGAYSWGFPNMGDTVPLVIQSGRLNVNTTVRVVGLTYDVGDDGDENVEIVVGRPLSSLGDLLARTATAVDALARR